MRMGRVIELNEPQIWTILGMLTAAFLGTLGIVSTLFTRVIRTEIGSVRGEIGSVRGEIGGVRGEIGGLRSEMNAKFEAVNARFDAVHGRIDALDRDVQVLVKHTFGLDRG